MNFINERNNRRQDLLIVLFSGRTIFLSAQTNLLVLHIVRIDLLAEIQLRASNPLVHLDHVNGVLLKMRRRIERLRNEDL